jgi:hypothetical protein
MILAGILFLAVLACVPLLAIRQRFIVHLDGLEAKIRKSGPSQAARSDLPAEVARLAAGMGRGRMTFQHLWVWNSLGRCGKSPAAMRASWALPLRLGADAAFLRLSGNGWRRAGFLQPAHAVV